MNIEEERTAFEAAYIKNRMDYAVKQGLSVEIMRVRVVEMLENAYPEMMFEIWLAAKAHAEEMAKPTVKIKPKGIHSEMSSYQWVVSLFEGEQFNGVLEDFRTADEAKVWAQANGYRVIE